ncbi:flavodoxin domain-containing protein [Eubacterium sp. 1001713B170207_170306_E7]|uniref:flavodoxin domain-containing protein n=1 Tax=Eubacterium sp. 1001713B170207_170306_E7 TaxID=2787097 RepID=UPI0018977578|nr:flavodoxin domain-containing protein [Eubacterium sp. 1001713B170207_170306_E7]
MSKIAIIYGSEYGSTEAYAQWLAQDLGGQAVSIKKIKSESLMDKDILIFGGGLYASGIKGLKDFKKKSGASQNKEIIIFTVGLADPKHTNYDKILSENFTGEERKQFKFFHLRGAIDYDKLSLPHRAMMAMMMRMLKSKPESLQENAEFIESYGKKTDFKDRSTLDPLLAYVQKLLDLKA